MSKTGTLWHSLARHPFWQPLWQARQVYAELLACILCSNLLALALPVFSKAVYDRVIPNSAEATLLVLATGALLALLFDLLFRGLRVAILAHYGRHVGQALEKTWLSHLLRVPVLAFPATSGHLLALTREVDHVKDFVLHHLLPAVVDVPFALLFLLLIFLISPPLVLIPLTAGILLFTMHWLVQHRLTGAGNAAQQGSMRREEGLMDAFAGRDTLQIHQGTARFLERFRTVSAEASQAATHHARLHGWAQNVSLFLAQAVTVLVLSFGALEVAHGTLTMGGLVAVNMLAMRAMTPVAALATVLAKLGHILHLLKAVEKTLALPTEATEDTTPSSLKNHHWQGVLQVQGVRYQYPAAALPVLDNISFKLEPGAKLALLGKSGSGKSTLLRLLAGQLAPASGQITMDAFSVAHVPPALWRRQMGIVAQSPYFFRGTVRDNIALGDETLEEQDWQRALIVSGLGDFLKESGLGLDMPVAEYGANLSGGQQQCLAIARAIAGDPPVFLLDEPTARMDHALEARLLNNLRFYFQRKTVVLVTHRLPVVSLADKVGIVEGGTFQHYGERDAVLAMLGVSSHG